MRPGRWFLVALALVSVWGAGCRVEAPSEHPVASRETPVSAPTRLTTPPAISPAPETPPGRLDTTPATPGATKQPSPKAGEPFAGECVGVTDGDTLRVMHNGREEKIRLDGVDAPEKSQPFGSRSKQNLSALVFGQVVTVAPTDRDRYGRTVARVYTADGRCVNAEQVGAGLAWWYREYALHDTALEALEAEARRARRGLWADPMPVAPWDFRNPHYGAILEEAGRLDETPGIVWRTKHGTCFHRETCSALHHEGYTVSRQEAQAAGLRPCSLCAP